MKYWLLFLSAILFIPNLSSRHLMFLPDKPLKHEHFNADLARKIQSTSQLITYIDSVAAVKGIRQNTNLYAYLILQIVEDRFFHSYSHYSLNENWIAALGGRYVWYDISAIVAPDDILKYPMAACSQQSIVLMSIFRAKNIPYRKVGFEGHYAVAAEFNKQWIFFDANLEPQADQNMQRMDYLLQGDHLAVYYKDVLTPNQIATLFKHTVTGKINIAPAPRITVFHNITWFLSHWLWVVPMCLFVFLMLKRYKTRFSKLLRSGTLSPADSTLKYTFHDVSKTPQHSHKKGAH